MNDDVRRLVEAIDEVSHSHKGMGHPQEGNTFAAWWSECIFVCPLCLASMRAQGFDVAFEFSRALPFRIHRYNLHLTPRDDFEAEFWRRAYLFTLRYVDDRWGNDREWMRERLAQALWLGMREAEAEGRAIAWIS